MRAGPVARSIAAITPFRMSQTNRTGAPSGSRRVQRKWATAGGKSTLAPNATCSTANVARNSVWASSGSG